MVESDQKNNVQQPAQTEESCRNKVTELKISNNRNKVFNYATPTLQEKASHWSGRNAMPKIQDVWLLAQVLHDRPHDAETLPIGVANKLPGRVPTKKFLVCICQKLLHFLLSILPNREQLLQIKAMYCVY
jgi:hypothetical protein